MSTVNLENKTILVTGAAGFIGSNLVKRIYEEVPSATVIGIDNMNAYYDVALKEFRLNELAKYPTFTFVKGSIADKALITDLFEKYKPAVVVNLAAQAGVRYSITNPDAYVESNLVGFFNILEACRHSYDDGQTGVEHRLLYQFIIRHHIRKLQSLTKIQKEWLRKRLRKADFGEKMRLHYYLGVILEDENEVQECFRIIQSEVLEATIKSLAYAYEPAAAGKGWKSAIVTWYQKFKESVFFRKLFLLFFVTSMILFRTLLNRNLWMNPLSKVMGGWGIWETVNGEQKLTTECIENVIMMVPFSSVVMWTFKEKTGNGWKKILWYSGKIAFIFSVSIEMLQLLLRLGTFQLSDIFYNTVGGMLGGLVYYVTMKARKHL